MVRSVVVDLRNEEEKEAEKDAQHDSLTLVRPLFKRLFFPATIALKKKKKHVTKKQKNN